MLNNNSWLVTFCYLLPTPGKWRLITNMSFPGGSSVNDRISEKLCSISYIGVQDAIHGILTYGKGALLAKVDIRNAHRVIPTHPGDWWFMGMYWQNSLSVDTALPFGLRSTPKIFTAFS